MSQRDLLVEIGTEELPPKALKSLGQAFLAGVEKGLNADALDYSSASWFATPRRLAVLVSGLVEAQPDRSIEKFGPAVQAAFNSEGQPTPAALGFARSCGTEVGALEQGEKDGVIKLLFRAEEKGQRTEELLEKIVTEALNRLPIPKRMRWGASRVEFVRPVHWVVMLFGADVVEATILGLEAGRTTRGHRFHHTGTLELNAPSDYMESLASPGHVLVDFPARKARIRDLVQAEAKALSANVAFDDALLDEVTSLVEWPVALTGRFDERFLEVPAEAIVSSLTSHQKCFHLTDDAGRLMPYFIAISNLESRDPRQVIEGNERVIRPRLADADFFYQTDRKQSLESRLDRLKSIVFQQQLGSLYDKSERVAKLAQAIAQSSDADPALCHRAGMLAKCDLVTDMVGEFAELQGVMGRYYALHDGEDPGLADALNEQYLPRHAGDDLPQSQIGRILALADKLDTVTGLFAIGQPPTGSKDPFALRRAAIGVLRILIESRFELDLNAAIKSAVSGLSASLTIEKDLDETVFEFFLERFRAWYQEAGIPTEVFQSVLAVRPSSPLDFDSRVRAVNHFSQLAEAGTLASANKRVTNILTGLDRPLSAYAVDESLLTEPAEKSLASAISSKELDVAPLFDVRNYEAGLESLASLKELVDEFFDNVLVMAEDTRLRDNRIALLIRLRGLFLRAADISFLHRS